MCNVYFPPVLLYNYTKCTFLRVSDSCRVDVYVFVTDVEEMVQTDSLCSQVPTLTSTNILCCDYFYISIIFPAAVISTRMTLFTGISPWPPSSSSIMEPSRLALVCNTLFAEDIG